MEEAGEELLEAGEEILEEASQIAHVAVEKLERAFDDINADVEQYEVETPLPPHVGTPTKELADLILSVNSGDKIVSQLQGCGHPIRLKIKKKVILTYRRVVVLLGPYTVVCKRSQKKELDWTTK